MNYSGTINTCKYLISYCVMLLLINNLYSNTLFFVILWVTISINLYKLRVDILTWTGNLLCHIQLLYLLNYIHLFLHNYYLITVTSETKAKRYVLRLAIKNSFIVAYVGVIRTLNSKYQKFMTYLLVHNI